MTDTTTTAHRVLAIGLDAAEPTLVERMIADGELPALAKLLACGSWSRVTSPAGYGSGTVWPTFFTGTDAVEHGQFTHWGWDPASMSLQYYDASRYAPFWQELDRAGVAVGVIDVPFAPHIGVDKGFEVLEWGAHAWVDGRSHLSPQAVHDTVTKEFGTHPFSHPLAAPPQDPAALSRQSIECVDGARLRGDVALRLLADTRPDLAIVIFPEVHHGGHFLWQTVEPDLKLYDDIRADPQPVNDLAELHRELDRQVARLVEAAEPGTAVFVFGLHGMEPGRGVPSVLEPMLEGMGLAHIAERTDRRQALVAAAKRRAPEWLRNVYRSTVPLPMRSEWGKASRMQAYDWSRTSAFSLPTDQYGWVRVNLVGREAQGIVPQAEYAAMLDRIEAEVRALTAADGSPVAFDVIRPPRSAGPDPLPDLVVHWTQAAFEGPIMVDGTATTPARPEETGQHSTNGFLIASGVDGPLDDTIEAKDIHRILTAALKRDGTATGSRR